MSAGAQNSRMWFRQAGVALLLGLVLLAAIGLLAVVATSSMIQQQRMAGNFSDAQSARQAAAWAVLQGEKYLFGVGQDQRAAGCSARCFLPPANAVIRQPEDLPPFPEHEDLAWWRSWGSAAGDGGESMFPSATPAAAWTFSSEVPHFLITEVHFAATGELSPALDAPAIDGVAFYRILGLGIGRNPSVQAVDEAIVARPWLGEHLAESEPGVEGCGPYTAWYPCGRMSWRQRK